jgi:D-tyrosyl-tRNA(Tyr) deacylase
VRAVVQRVSRARVEIDGRQVAGIGAGLLVLLAVGQQDGEEDVEYMARKLAGLRIFEDAEGKMNLSVAEVDGAVLLVSQFTLYGDCRRGRRPSFTRAAAPEVAVPLYRRVAEKLRQTGLEVATGRFQEMMQVELVNDGPVTVLLDSEKAF